MHEKKIFFKKIPIEKVLKKYPVNALEGRPCQSFLQSFWWTAPEFVFKNKYKVKTSNKTNMWYISFT